MVAHQTAEQPAAEQPNSEAEPWEPHEKFLRALLHVIAGIIAALTVIITAGIQGIGSSVAQSQSANRISMLYTIIFSEAVMHSAVILFFATVTAVIIQILRSANKNLSNRCRLGKCNIIYSVAALSIVVLLILLPLFRVAKVAVCGSAALSKPSEKLNNEETRKRIGNLPPQWLPGDCQENIGRWFAEADAS